jgi:hypothetical protein
MKYVRPAYLDPGVKTKEYTTSAFFGSKKKDSACT